MPVLIECPECATRYRVAEERLKAQAYRVRCGRCRCVFDAREHRLAVPAEVGPVENKTEGVPISQESHESSASSVPDTPRFSERESHFFNQKTLFDQKTLLESLFSSQDTSALTFSDAKKRVLKQRWKSRLRAAVVFVVMCCVVSGGAMMYRDEVVGYFPSLYGPLKHLCGLWNCQVSWPRHADRLTLSALELHVDSDHPNSFVLIGLLKNPTAQVLQIPMLHLTLLNIQGRFLSVKKFMPEQYLDGTSHVSLMPGEEQDVHATFTVKASDGIESFRAGLRDLPLTGQRTHTVIKHQPS